PETILLQAIQAGDTRQQSQDKDVHTHFRFLWETYKVILDVLKSNSRLEEALQFFVRVAEFVWCILIFVGCLAEDFRKKVLGLSELICAVVVWSLLQWFLVEGFWDSFVGTFAESWLACEAYNTSSEICDLMTALGKVNQRPKPHLRSMYYEHLGQIFWKSENYLFHAFASLKNVFFVKVRANARCLAVSQVCRFCIAHDDVRLFFAARGDRCSYAGRCGLWQFPDHALMRASSSWFVVHIVSLKAAIVQMLVAKASYLSVWASLAFPYSTHRCIN
ncbi:TIF32, partial [Symbiodinium sp. CCMP2456]